jgi:hypothetical protein
LNISSEWSENPDVHLTNSPVSVQSLVDGTRESHTRPWTLRLTRARPEANKHATCTGIASAVIIGGLAFEMELAVRVSACMFRVLHR